MSDIVLVAIITGVFGAINAAIAGFIALQIGKLNKISKQTHILVNSNMGIQLKISAIALRHVAKLTKEQIDIDAADQAQAALSDHEKKQAIVDLKT